jgi:hypothetical protein
MQAREVDRTEPAAGSWYGAARHRPKRPHRPARRSRRSVLKRPSRPTVHRCSSNLPERIRRRHGGGMAAHPAFLPVLAGLVVGAASLSLAAPSAPPGPVTASPPPATARPEPTTTPPGPAATPSGPPPATVTSPAAGPSTTGQVGQRGSYAWPLSPRPPVLRRFAVGPYPWSPGHRGVDLTGAAGQPVLGAGAGTVAFAGTVAGRGVVSVQHPDGLRTTYEPVLPRVTAGQRIAAGQPVGILLSGHRPDAVALHWGARRGERYLDPLRLLGGPGGPAVLLPLGTQGTTAPAHRESRKARTGPARTPPTYTRPVSTPPARTRPARPRPDDDHLADGCPSRPAGAARSRSARLDEFCPQLEDRFGVHLADP